MLQVSVVETGAIGERGGDSRAALECLRLVGGRLPAGWRPEADGDAVHSTWSTSVGIVPAAPAGAEPTRPPAAATDEKLVRLAAAASRTAAASPRLELYPRGMSAARALELSAQVLGSGLPADDRRRRVAARYPDAEPRPDRPERGTLVEAACGLRFDPASGQYLRPADHASGSLHTSWTSYDRPSSAVTPERRTSEKEAAAAVFEERIQSCLERCGLLAFGVDADKAEAAARALKSRFSLRRQSFDSAFLAALGAAIDQKGIDPSVVHAADAADPASDAWKLLTKLCAEAADNVANDLLPPSEPLLLTEAGLLHRYQLKQFFRALVDASKRGAAEATILLLPGQGGGSPTIESRTAVPGLLPGQQVSLASAWLHGEQPLSEGASLWARLSNPRALV